MSTIQSILGRRVWDSRGNPTVEAEVTLTDGSIGRAIAPSGASRGEREAIELRDGGKRLGGKDVSRAVANVNGPIAARLRGMPAADQAGVDAAMLALDGTPLKTELGGNAIVAVSLAILHAAAASARLPLWRYLAETHGATPTIPLPEIQIFGGGAHAGRRVDIQDFMIMVPGADDLEEAMEVTNAVYHAAGRLMEARGEAVGVADEGGWWPTVSTNEEALELLVQAVEAAGEVPGERVVISLDVAASEFERDGRYILGLDGLELDSGEWLERLGNWVERYPIVSIEDPASERDPEGMRAFTARWGDRLQIVGDDYLVTNARLIEAAAGAGGCNASLIKVNQAGTVTETIEALRVSQERGFGTLVSARSGETEDVSICHLAAGLDAGQLKVGSFARSERMAKWNECLRFQGQAGMGAFVGGRPIEGTWWGAKRP
jgi:enolase